MHELGRNEVDRLLVDVGNLDVGDILMARQQILSSRLLVKQPSLHRNCKLASY